MVAPRVRGFAPWNPHQATKEVLDQVSTILETYSDLLPLTCRQVFYRLVARFSYDKTEKAYKRLLEYMNRARRAGLIDWDAIRDDGATAVNTSYWSSPEEFLYAVRSETKRLNFDLMSHQDIHIEVFCEAAGMVPQMQRVASPFGIAVRSSGGFDSTTTKHRLARFYAQTEKPVVVLHVGDLDPSGVHLAKALSEDISSFLNNLGGDFELDRIAVTPEQTAEYDLPKGAVKDKDARQYDLDFSVQAEALDPSVLADIVRHNILSLIDVDAHQRALEWQMEQRQMLSTAVGGLSL